VIRPGLVAVLLVAACATGCRGHGEHGTIVFESTSSGHAALYAIRADGSGLRRLALRLPADGADVVWSRDATKALVVYYTDTGAVASVFDAVTGVDRRLRIPGLASGDVQADVSAMPWSPDGGRLVLATGEGDVVLDLRTGAHPFIDDSTSDDLVAWSGDGKSLLFTTAADSSGFADVYAAPADGAWARRLMRLDFEPGALRSSPDGKWISFSRLGPEHDTLYVVRRDGHDRRLVSRNAGSAVWSPTEDRLAFADSEGLGLFDAPTGRRRRLTTERVDDPANEPVSWSTDGRTILYRRVDLVDSGGTGGHLQLWRMNADGTCRHPVTHGFAVDYGGGAAAWTEATLKGTPAPRLPLVSLRAERTLTTRLPVAALAAAGDRAAVAQGFGGPPSFREPLGPIVVWNRVDGSAARVAVNGCGSVDDVLLVAGRVGYRCDNSSEGYTVRDALRVGTAVVARVHGEEFSGTFLGGLAADGDTVAFGVESAGSGTPGEFSIRRSRIWRATGGRKALVRTFRGVAEVASLDRGRIAVLRGDDRVSVLDGSRVKTFAFGSGRVLGAALDGSRLVVLGRKLITVVDPESGRHIAARPVRRGFGPDPELQDVQGDLAAYVVGAAIHVLRLSDGRELVVDTPNATAPVFARFVPDGLFYSFNESYARRPGRLVFVARRQVERALRR